jgi:hypothetical protein
MRNLTLVLGGLLVISGIVSVNLWRELRDERQQNLDLRAQLLQERGQVATASMPAPGTQVTFEASRPAEVAPAATTPTTPARNDGPQTAGQANAALNDVLAQQRELLKDPEYRRARLAQLRMTMPQTYPDVAEELNLTADQANALYDLLAEFQLKSSESSYVPAGTQQDPAQAQEFLRLRQETMNERDRQVAALLGDAGRDRFNAYEQTRGARTQARSTQRQLEDLGMPPLRPEQARALTDAYISAQQVQREFAQQRTRPNPTPAESLELQMEMQAARNRSLIESVRPHFTAQQLERFQASLDQQLTMNRASMRMSIERSEAQQRAARESGGGSEGPPAAVFMPF